MDFSTAATLGAYISKPYAKHFFELLVNYKDISASEAASRLDLHIKTAQEFLEAMASLGVVTKTEVREKKRPYFRYALEQTHIKMDIDLTKIKKADAPGAIDRKIRERSKARVRFSPARGRDAISAVTIWIGEGRERRERRISLTRAQGSFVYHLPFPGAESEPIAELMARARVQSEHTTEVLDMVDMLIEFGVIEIC